jgi:gas vesicle protein
MSRDRNSNSGANIVWFLAGLSAGAAVGLLCAPASGAETRRQLLEKTERSKAYLATSGRDYMDKGRELYDKGRRLADEAAEMFDEGRKLVEG